MAPHCFRGRRNSLNLKNYQEVNYQAKKICVFARDSSLPFSQGSVQYVGISTHAFLSQLRCCKRGAHLGKAPLEVPESSATWGSLKHRMLASCLRHCAWTEGCPEVQCLTRKPHSSSLADTPLCIVLQSSVVEQAAVAEGPTSASWRRWKDCFTSCSFSFQTTYHILAKTLLRVVELARPSTLLFKEEIKDLVRPWLPAELCSKALPYEPEERNLQLSTYMPFLKTLRFCLPQYSF